VDGVQGAARRAACHERRLDRGQAARSRRVACAQHLDPVMPLSDSSSAVLASPDPAWTACVGTRCAGPRMHARCIGLTGGAMCSLCIILCASQA